MTGVLTDESRSWIGRRATSPPFLVTAVEIAKFAYAIGATDPAHFDAGAARAHGFPDIVAPLGFYLTVRETVPNLIPLDELKADGVSSDMTPPSAATRRMAGKCTTRFHRRITAGDVITLTKTLTGMSEKQGRSGALAFVTYELEFTDEKGEPVVSETFVTILR